MIYLLALDPGGRPMSSVSRSATGWSLWSLDDGEPVRHVMHGQVPGDEHAFTRWFRWMLDGGLGHVPSVVVSESFMLDGRTTYPDVTPLKIEGVLAALWGDSVIFQPNISKSALPDEKVKRFGLWWVGQPHAIDSARHAFYYARSIRHMPTIELLSGRREP